MRGVSANPPGKARTAAESRALVEAERSGRPFLVFRDRDDRQQLFLFAPDSVSVSVGRRPSSDLILDWDDQISRLHARFERAEDGWVLVDDGFSSNGTFVNGERVTGARALSDGDSLRFGITTATFRSPRSERPEIDRPAPHDAIGTPDARDMPASVVLSTTQRRVLAALCRPYKGRSDFAEPATDDQIADELVLSVREVRAHVRVLCAKLDVEPSREGDPRARLVERAFSAGLISEGDL